MPPTSLKAPTTSSNPTLRKLEEWYDKHEKEIQDDFFSFLKIPSISADPAYKQDVLSAANWVRDYLQKSGMKAELWETSHYPVVFASKMVAADRPTILFYHHYDVQPVDPLELWKAPPFEPTIRGKEVYARGAADNKGQCFYAMAALRAFFELCDALRLNIKVFVEGEEESGSRGSVEIAKKRAKELKADHLLIVDLGIPAPGIPAITLGLRGITTMEVTVRNSNVDLHSGGHGGTVLNPNRALVNALSKLWDASGKIAVPGFYDAVKMPTKEEQKIFNQSFDETELSKNFGIRAFKPEPGFSLWESNFLRPTMEINGISGGYAGEGFKTVIPSVAKAKISCRLVPDQDPDTIAALVAKYLKDQFPSELEVQVTLDHGGNPHRSSPSAPIAQICAGAYEEVLGKPCQKLLCGGSVPITSLLAEVTGAEVAMIGVALDTDDFHAPNEHFGLDRLRQGFLTIGRILAKVNA
ncbi:MAG: dipeptidase [Verrucomicrobia bacterium]|nr:dipeptidase [Verrucomicrobiota bacterium]